MTEQNQIVDQQQTIPVAATTDTFDTHYQRLRTAIAEAFTTAMAQGKTLFRSNAANPISYGTFMALVPQENKAHYKCNCCAGFMNRYAGFLLQNDDGSYYSPVADILKADEYFSEVLKKSGINLDLKAALRSARPVNKLHGRFHRKETIGVKDGESYVQWTHMYGADQEVVVKYNMDNAASGETMNRAVEVLKQIDEIGTANHDFVTRIHGVCAERLKNPTTIGLLIPYAAFLKRLDEVKVNRTAFVAAVLMRPDYSWLNQINASSAGSVLEILPGILRQPSTLDDQIREVVRKINIFTNQEVYKKRTAEASRGLVEGTVEMLKEEGMENALARTPVVFEDLSYIWETKGEVKVTKETNEALQEGLSALDAAAKKLTKGEESTGAEANAALAAFENANMVSKSISIKSFVEMLKSGDIANVKLAVVGANQFPTTWTKPADGKPYSELFKTIKGFQGDDLLGISLANGVTSLEAMYFAADEGVTEPFDYVDIRGFVTVMSDDGVSIVSITGICNNVGAKLFRNHSGAGSFVFGGHITQAYYGFSRALVQLSENFKMEIPDNAAGGFMLGVGHALKVQMTDGSVRLYALSSIN